MKNEMQFLTMVGCHTCEEVKAVLEAVMPEFADKIKLTEIDITSEEGQALVGEHMIMASPGIVINGELFSVGGIDKDKLVKKLESL